MKTKIIITALLTLFAFTQCNKTPLQPQTTTVKLNDPNLVGLWVLDSNEYVGQKAYYNQIQDCNSSVYFIAYDFSAKTVEEIHCALGTDLGDNYTYSTESDTIYFINEYYDFKYQYSVSNDQLKTVFWDGNETTTQWLSKK